MPRWPVAILGALITCIAVANPPWPAFTALSLNGESVHSAALVGQPTLLIVTPSRDAAAATRLWVRALEKRIDSSRLRVRDVIALDLPFFMSAEDALPRARAKIPARYHGQTWLLDSPVVEKALQVPVDSHEACIVVLDRSGQVVLRIHGPPTDERLDEVLVATDTLFDGPHK